jgi:hypothetical protein
MEDPEVEKAATKIQAGFRGLQTRKQLRHETAEYSAGANNAKENEVQLENDENILDIDMGDPEVEKAATKIQAGFRGHQTRKQLKHETADCARLNNPNENEPENN